MLAIRNCESLLTDPSLFCSINEILNDGLQDVEKGCKGICSHVKSKYLQQTCSILCDAVGLIEFVKIIKTKDFDPIYYCEGLSAAIMLYKLPN